MKIDSTEFGSITINGTTHFNHHDCRVILQPAPDAIETCNKTKGKAGTVGLFHVTC